jgi:hypothetical protein
MIAEAGTTQGKFSGWAAEFASLERLHEAAALSAKPMECLLSEISELEQQIATLDSLCQVAGDVFQADQDTLAAF